MCVCADLELQRKQVDIGAANIISCIIIIYSVMRQYYSVKQKHTSNESDVWFAKLERPQ